MVIGGFISFAMISHKFITFLAIFFLLSLSYSCINGEDEEYEGNVQGKLDYTLPASGSIRVTNDDGKSYNRQIQDAGYLAWSTDINELPTLTLSAFFKNEGDDSNKSILINDRRISQLNVVVYDLKKLAVGKIADGGTVKVNCFINDGNGYYDWSSQEGYFSGDVRITKFDANKYLTVSFTNCEFGTSSTYSPQSTRTKGSFSGNIKFPLRPMNFFE